VLNDVLLELFGVGARKTIDLLALLDEHERWHGRDVITDSQFLAFVDIDLEFVK
jgi:hypothetical protein